VAKFRPIILVSEDFGRLYFESSCSSDGIPPALHIINMKIKKSALANLRIMLRASLGSSKKHSPIISTELLS
jgi:hypothetical protein